MGQDDFDGGAHMRQQAGALDGDGFAHVYATDHRGAQGTATDPRGTVVASRSVRVFVAPDSGMYKIYVREERHGGRNDAQVIEITAAELRAVLIAVAETLRA